MDDRAARREALFQAALDLPPDERSSFLERECMTDPVLRREVVALLAHYTHSDPAFLEGSVVAGVREEVEVPLSVGPYRIVRRIGEGGMGIVYEAEQERPRRRIAVKVLRPGLYGDEQLRRFRLECDVLGQLSHPGIAHVHDAGTAPVVFARSPTVTLPYMAMELIDGRHLIEHVMATGLDRRARLELFARVCDAVDHAHQQAIIHRDLKPSNILVDGSGQPKILDFGVARVAGGEEAMSRRTRTGDIIGTLRYMSPEQLRADHTRIDVRTDVYSLGVILFEMLTGESPHGDTNSSIHEMVTRIARKEPPRASAHDRTLRGDLDAVVATALAPEAGNRYASAAALADDVRRHLNGDAVAARGERVRDIVRRLVRRHRTAVSVAVIFLALVSGSSILAWTLFTQARRARIAAEAERAKAEERLWESYLSRAALVQGSGSRGRRLQSLENLRRAAEIRPSIEVRDGVIAALALSDVELVATAPGTRYVSARGLARTDRVAISDENGLTRICSLPDCRELMRLQGPDHPIFIQVFSPDGRYLAAKYHERSYDQKDVRFWVWDLSTGRTVLELDEGEMVAGGVEFGTSPSMGGWVAIAETDGQVHVYTLSAGARWRVLGPPVWAVDMTSDPARRYLAASSASGQLVVWDVESGLRTRIARLPGVPSEVAWTVDQTVLVGDDDGTIYEWDPATGRTLRAFRGHQAQVSELALSTDGNLVASQSWDSTMRLWDFRSGRQLLAPFHGEYFSGIGDRIVSLSGDQVRTYRHVPNVECRSIYTEAPFVTPVSADLHPGGRLLVTTDAQAGVRIWDLVGGHRTLCIPGTGWRFASIVDGPVAAEPAAHLLTFRTDSLLAWPIDVSSDRTTLGTPEPIWTDKGPSDGGACLDASRTRVMVTSPRGTVLLDPRTGERLLTLPGHPGVSTPALDPGDRWAFIGTWRQGRAQVWNLETRSIALEIEAISVAGAFSPDGRLLLVCDGPTLTAYDVGSWSVRYRIEETGRGPSARPPVFSRDGRTIALGGDYDIRLYDSLTGRRLATLTPPEPSLVSAFCFTPDARALIAPMRDRVIHIWDLARIRQQLAELRLDWE